MSGEYTVYRSLSYLLWVMEPGEPGPGKAYRPERRSAKQQWDCPPTSAIESGRRVEDDAAAGDGVWHRVEKISRACGGRCRR